MAMRGQANPARYKNERRKNRKEHDQPFTLRLQSYVPSKWRLVDLETGEVYRWDGSKAWVDQELTNKQGGPS